MVSRVATESRASSRRAVCRAQRATSNDGPEAETIHGLAERKNAYALAHLARDGVQTYEAATALILDARARGFRTAVVSASENRAAVLRAVGLETLFDVRVDGTDLDRLALQGKPAPDTFLEAARRLGVSPARAVVFEDAIAGVQAGRAGGFALVVGVDRVGHAEALRRNGADVVVTRLSDLELTGKAAARPDEGRA
jgi:alpha,alpha-trehalase